MEHDLITAIRISGNCYYEMHANPAIKNSNFSLKKN